jgi:hypothetical protein
MIICQLLIHGILKAVYKQRDHSKDSPFIHHATNKSDSSEGNKKLSKDKSSKELLI